MLPTIHQNEKIMEQNYYVFAPFEILSQAELDKRRDELLREMRKIIAVIFNCKNDRECSDRYFNYLERCGIESPCSLRATMLIS